MIWFAYRLITGKILHSKNNLKSIYYLLTIRRRRLSRYSATF